MRLYVKTTAYSGGLWEHKIVWNGNCPRERVRERERERESRAEPQKLSGRAYQQVLNI